MYEKKTVILLVGGIVVVAAILMSLFCFFILLHFGDDDQYNVTRNYSIDGTIIEFDVTYDCTGTGISKPINENPSEHIYRFTFDVRYSESSKKELIFDLFCDKKGNPLESMYTKHTDQQGNVTWSCSSDGVTYEFAIEQYCKVTKMNITGNGMDLIATITE